MDASAAPTRVILLGGTDIRLPDGISPPLSSRAVALLGLLVVHGGSAQPRSRLAGLLWPDSPEGQARTNLRRELHLLRAALGRDSGLQTEGSHLLWQPSSPPVVDVIAFRQARQRAEDAVAGGDAEGVAAAGEAALAAYQGAFLPGCHDEWAVEARDELQRACVDLCAHVADFWAGRGDPTSGMPFARRRVQLAPLEELGYLQLMTLQRQVGDRAGAMTTYHQCASVMERELGVAPGSQVRQAFDSILREPRSGSGTGAGHGDVARPGSSTLVGRRRERAALLSSWGAARHGSRFVLVTGDAGVGKSRLVEELAADVRREEGVVLTARCFATTGALPYAPVAEWLRDPHLRQAVRRLDPVWRVEAERLAPAGRGAEAGPGSGTRAKVDAWQRLRFYEALARVVGEVGRPVLLTLDDLQWCDRASLAWISFLLSFPSNSPVLIVATAREDELARSDLAEPVRSMRSAGRVELLTLSDLDEAGTGALAAQVLGRAVDSDELALLRSVTGGNPFYVIEALRDSHASRGPVVAADLGGVLASRLARLPQVARDVAALAAAVGRDFPLELVIEASDLTPDEVVAAVDVLWRHRLLVQDAQRYDFAHDLLRNAAYATITPARRWLIHRRLAQALDLTHVPEDASVAAQVGEQYERGGQGERALPFYVRAARQASAVFAHDEAVRLWDRALEVLATLPPHRGRDERELGMLVEKLPPLNAFRGYTAPGMERTARRLVTLAEGLDRPEERATGLITLWATIFVQGRIRDSLELGRDALTSTEAAPALAAQGHMVVAGSSMSLGLVTDACRHFEAACDHAGEIDSLPMGTRTQVHAQGWWAHAQWLRGDAELARTTAREAVDEARHIEHPYSLAVGLAYAAVTAQLDGDRDRLGASLHELGVLCDRYRFAYYSEWAEVLDGWLRGGPEGEAQARRGLRGLVAEDSLARMPYWLSLLADIRLRRGDVDGASGVLDAARVHAARHGDVWWLPEVLRVRSSLAAPPDAERILREAADLAGSHGSTRLQERCLRDLDDLVGAERPVRR